MAQFDLILVFPILWSSIFVLIMNYYLTVQIILPKFTGLLKFRKKLLQINKPNILKLKIINK